MKITFLSGHTNNYVRYTVNGTKNYHGYILKPTASLQSKWIPTFCGGRVLGQFTGFDKVTIEELVPWVKTLMKNELEDYAGILIAFFQENYSRNLREAMLQAGFKKIGEYYNPNTANRITELRCQLVPNL